MPRTAPVLVAILAVLLLSCGGVVRPRVQSRTSFEKEFRGATLESVRWSLGAPDDSGALDRSGGPDGYWVYRKRTIDDGAKEPDANVMLYHKAGRVAEIVY